LFIVNTAQLVYNSQPRWITRVAVVDRWPLFGASEAIWL